MTRFMRAHDFQSYDAVWQWSVDDLEGFWGALWDFFELGERAGPVLASRDMPGARSFPEVRLNYSALVPGEEAQLRRANVPPAHPPRGGERSPVPLSVAGIICLG